MTFDESIGVADEVAHGSCTDFPPGNDEVYFISDRIKVGLLVHEAGLASHHERGRTWRGAAGPCESTHARTRATQTFTGALPVGGVDRFYLRSFPVAVPAVWWTDAPGPPLLRARWGFLREVRALPRADTWPHMVQMPILSHGAMLAPCG